MSKISKQQLISLALESSDPAIKSTVDKLLFMLKLKYADDDWQHIIDNYKYHHSAILHFANDKEISLAWRNEDFAFISMDHMYYKGQAADMVAGEVATHHYIAPDLSYKAP